jgi:hypothetical protein
VTKNSTTNMAADATQFHHHVRTDEGRHWVVHTSSGRRVAWASDKNKADALAHKRTERARKAAGIAYVACSVTDPSTTPGVTPCPLCTDSRVCDHYHLYVIELDAAFPSTLRGSRPGHARAIYVGHTWHRPPCRLTQHRTFARGDIGYTCICTDKRRFLRFRGHGGKTKGVKLAGLHAVGLRHELFGHLNPREAPTGVRGEDARQAAYAAEAALATMLHEQGYNVLTDKGTMQRLRQIS